MNSRTIQEIISSQEVTSQQRFYLSYLLLFTIVTGLLIPFIPDTFQFDIIRGGILLSVLIYFFTKKRIFNLPARLIVWFALLVLFMAIVNFFRQNHFEIVSLKILITSLFFIVGYNLVRGEKGLYLLIRSFYIGIIIFLVAIALFNFLGIEGKAIYGSQIAIFGPQGTNLTKEIPLLLFPSMLLFNFNIAKRRRNIIYLLFVISIVLMLIGQKRGTLLSFGIGFLIYIYFIPNKKRILNILIISILFMAATSVLYWDLIEEVYMSRQERYSIITEGNEDALETEARYWEFISVTGDLENRNIFEIFFGIGFGSWKIYWGTSRMLHTDYMMFLNDTGLVGLFLYLFIYFKIIQIARYRKNCLSKIDPLSQSLFGMVVLIVVVSMIQGISGFSHGTNLRAYSFLFLGGALGYFDYHYTRLRAEQKRL